MTKKELKTYHTYQVTQTRVVNVAFEENDLEGQDAVVLALDSANEAGGWDIVDEFAEFKGSFESQ